MIELSGTEARGDIVIRSGGRRIDTLTHCVTDKLGFYGAALPLIGFSERHKQSLRANNPRTGQFR